MKIELLRKYKKLTYCIGLLFIDGKFFCNTIEDTDRNLRQGKDSPEKIKYIKSLYPQQTAIPMGEYKVVLTQSPKFKRVLPRLLDVPGFDGILIHSGNTNKDTSGCVLVGINDVKGSLTKSKETLTKLMKILNKAKDEGEDITIKIW